MLASYAQITLSVSPDRETLEKRLRRKAIAKSSLKHQRKTGSFCLPYCLCVSESINMQALACGHGLEREETG